MCAIYNYCFTAYLYPSHGKIIIIYFFFFTLLNQKKKKNEKE